MNRRVLIRVTAEAIREAFQLPPQLMVERIWQTDADKSRDAFTLCIRGEGLPIQPEGEEAPYVDPESLRTHAD